MTATNTFYDLLSSNPDYGYYKRLQEEAAAVFQKEQDWAEPSLLIKLQYADSTLRETLRKSPVLTKGMLREVVRREGLDLPDGLHVPKGAWLGASTVSLHHDERFYPNPGEYDPFRFTNTQTESVDAQTDMSSKYRKLQGLSTTSDIYLAFGYGRHSW